MQSILNRKRRKFIKVINNFIVMITARTQVREILKESELGIENMSSDFMDRLDERVKELIVKAAQRAKENSRKTVMGRDV
jgi:histone H3/H4